MRFNPPPIRPKEFTFKDFLKLFEEENYEEALERLFKNLTVEQRVDITIQYIKNTKYNAYKIAMKNFISAINRYKLTGSKDDLNIYLDNLVNTGEATLDAFTDTRKEIIEDLLTDDFNCSVEAILNTASFFNSYETDVIEAQTKSLLIDAAALKWEEAKSMKVLFGAQ